MIPYGASIGLGMLASSIVSAADPVAMITDLTGSSTILENGLELPASIVLPLASGSEVRVNAGGTLTIVYYDSGVEYRIEGYAAFYLTGYRFPDRRQPSLVTNQVPCGQNDMCISGYFVGGQLIPPPGVIGGPSMGVAVIQVIG